MKYKVRSRASFPYEFDIYEVVKGDTWYASFAFKEDAEEYAKLLSSLHKNKQS